MKEVACWCVHCFSLISKKISRIGKHHPHISYTATEITNCQDISPEAEWQWGRKNNEVACSLMGAWRHPSRHKRGTVCCKKHRWLLSCPLEIVVCQHFSCTVTDNKSWWHSNFRTSLFTGQSDGAPGTLSLVRLIATEAITASGDFEDVWKKNFLRHCAGSGRFDTSTV